MKGLRRCLPPETETLRSGNRIQIYILQSHTSNRLLMTVYMGGVYGTLSGDGSFTAAYIIDFCIFNQQQSPANESLYSATTLKRELLRHVV